MPERQCLRKTLEQSAGTEPCKEGCEGFEGAELHTQGGPRRRPALARARQGRRISDAVCPHFHMNSQSWSSAVDALNTTYPSPLPVFFDLQARATSEIAVADLNDSENR